jgi:hypothetical protein
MNGFKELYGKYDQNLCYYLLSGVDFIQQFTPYAWNLRSAHIFFPFFSIMYLRLTPNLLDFLPELGALYALRRAPNFYEIHPWLLMYVYLSFATILPYDNFFIA